MSSVDDCPNDHQDPYVGGVPFATGTAYTFAPLRVRGFYVGTAGHLVVTTPNGDTITLSNLLAGNVYRISISSITASGSTAVGVALL